MADTIYGVRNYNCSDKTKRPQKVQLDNEKLEKRNTSQRRLYINLDNIDEIFSNNDDKWPVCYDLIFNTIQGKVTKYFNTRSYDRKKELSYDCMVVLYSTLKRKLLRMKDNQGLLKPPPVLFFYLSQFFRYIDLIVYSVVFHGTQDTKFIVQEPENFHTDDILFDNYNDDSFINSLINEIDESQPIEYIDNNLDDNSSLIKKAIESNQHLSDKEKNVLLKIYKNSYSLFGTTILTKRDEELLKSIQERLDQDPDLLKDLEEILNA